MIESKTTTTYRLNVEQMRRLTKGVCMSSLIHATIELATYQTKPALMAGIEECIRLCGIYLNKDKRYFTDEQLSHIKILRDEMTQELEKAALLP